MPCSRSARRPSVTSDSSVYSCPRSLEVRSTEAHWSSITALESYSSRPISVDLPSSTEPAVAMRSNVAMSISPVASLAPSEVALSLAVFRSSLGNPVVGAGGASLGQPRYGRLGDHLGHRARRRLDAAGAGD